MRSLIKGLGILIVSLALFGCTTINVYGDNAVIVSGIPSDKTTETKITVRNKNNPYNKRNE
jgi:hypothetical protein